MRLNEEVFAVVVAISVVGSALSIALILPRGSEPFTALGLLGEERRIDGYPREVFVGERVRLWLSIANYMGYTALFMVQGKIGYGDTPSSGVPLNSTLIIVRRIVVCNKCNITIPVEVVFDRPWSNQTLVFELYIYDANRGIWSYTGRYVFLRLNVVEVVLP
ncbi:MAG: DUF1616 domain-containing protein [Nitrososphaerota archaeon]